MANILKLITYITFVILIFSCGKPDDDERGNPILKTQLESDLPPSVYAVIIGSKSKIEEKNNIMSLIAQALKITPKVKSVHDQAIRDKAIEDAVANNGNELGLADKIKAEIDKVYPL